MTDEIQYDNDDETNTRDLETEEPDEGIDYDADESEGFQVDPE